MKETNWNKHLMKVFNEMKEKDSSTSLKEAMKEARKTWKKYN